jgi:hypothetical protein
MRGRVCHTAIAEGVESAFRSNYKAAGVSKFGSPGRSVSMTLKGVLEAY